MCIVIAALWRLAGYSLYVSNSSTTKTDGHLCFHHTGSALPSVYQDVNCNHLGQSVIIYNERNGTKVYPNTYSVDALLELCKVRIFGKCKYLSDVYKCVDKKVNNNLHIHLHTYLTIAKKLRMLKYFDNVQCSYFAQYMLEKTLYTRQKNISQKNEKKGSNCHLSNSYFAESAVRLSL